MMRSYSVTNPEQEEIFSLKKYIIDNLKIKQAFLNCLMMVMNNFLAYEQYEFPDEYTKIKELIFDYKAYLDSINSSFIPFYRRLFETQMFNSFLKDKKDGHCVRIKEFMKYYNICFKKSKVITRDRDSLDLMKSCSENYTDVIDNQKYSGVDFLKDDEHHVIQMNKLKFKQNSQIERLLSAIESQFFDSSRPSELDESSETKISSALQSKFLSDESSVTQNIHQHSVASVHIDKLQFVKLFTSKLFNKSLLEDYVKSIPEDTFDEAMLKRKDFKNAKSEHKSFVHGNQHCHLHKKQPVTK